MIEMSLPIVAIVGRPNVGKSTLVNRIISSQQAIVDERLGVTRDRIYYLTDWRGCSFTLVDTGGMQFGKLMPVSQLVQQQALIAIDEATVIIFLVDALTGVMPDDEEIAKVLRSTAKPVILTVNKVDTERQETMKYDFCRLGIGEPVDISASHGRNIGDFLDLVISYFPPEPQERKITDLEASIAIVGRPNVGKSSLLNKLIGQERVIVSEQPGTTRDAIDTTIERSGRIYTFIDTAGLKKTTKRIDDLDYYGMVRTLKTLDRADLALFVIDSSEGITSQDQKIAELIINRGCAAVVLLNKSDLLHPEQQEDIRKELEEKLRYVSYLPILRISALTGLGLKRIFNQIEGVMREYRKRVPTVKLNRLLSEIKARGYFPSKGKKRLKITYLTQVKSAPPGFVFFVNHPELVDVSFQRYLENQLREKFGFIGCPIRLFFKAKK